MVAAHTLSNTQIEKGKYGTGKRPMKIPIIK